MEYNGINLLYYQISITTIKAPSFTTIGSESELKGKWENEETKPPAKSQLERVGVLPPTNKEERTHEEQNAQIKEQ